MGRVTIFICAMFLLLGSVNLIEVRHFKGSTRVQPQMHDLKSSDEPEKHEQAQAAIIEAAAKALIQNPQGVAQIPSKFINGYVDGMKSVFQGAWAVKDRSRSIQLSLSNLLDNRLILEDTYFDSGTWYQSWQPIIGAKSIMQGTVANKQGSFFTGVTGGARLRIQGTNLYVYIGFTSPYIGSYKNYGEISNRWKSAKYGYDNSRNNNPKIQTFNGYQIQVIQTTSTICKMAFVYQISKV